MGKAKPLVQADLHALTQP